MARCRETISVPNIPRKMGLQMSQGEERDFVRELDVRYSLCKFCISAIKHESQATWMRYLSVILSREGVVRHGGVFPIGLFRPGAVQAWD